MTHRTGQLSISGHEHSADQGLKKILFIPERGPFGPLVQGPGSLGMEDTEASAFDNKGYIRKADSKRQGNHSLE